MKDPKDKKKKPEEVTFSLDPEDLGQNVQDWLDTPRDIPATRAPWEESSAEVPVVEPARESLEDGLPPDEDDDPLQPAPAPPWEEGREAAADAEVAHVAAPLTPSPMVVSAPWSAVAPPHRRCGVGLTGPVHKLRARASSLRALENERLGLMTRDGAPFKVPLDHISMVMAAAIDEQDRKWLVCDLVHGQHRAAGRWVVETIRMYSTEIDYDSVLPGAAEDEHERFVELLNKLRDLLPDVDFVPDEPRAIPTYEDLVDYETVLLQHLTEEG